MLVSISSVHSFVVLTFEFLTPHIPSWISILFAGNIIYRRVVEHNKTFYQSVQKRHRILVSQSIVHTILKRGGRFLSEDTKTIRNADGTTSTVTLWKTVATARAVQKTSQALRERVAAAAAAATRKDTTAAGDGDSQHSAEETVQLERQY